MARLDQMILDRGVPLPDDKLRSPWYANECSRATSARIIAQELDIDYLGSGGQFFSAEAVQETIKKYARPALLVGDLEYDHQTGEPTRFRESDTGKLRLWFLLDKDGKPKLNLEHKVSLGCDISAGTGASNSVGCAWNNRTCEKLAEFVNPHIRPEQFAMQMMALAKWLNNAHVLWEANGPGRQFGAVLVDDMHYGNVYLRKNDSSITGTVSNVPGFAQTDEAKLLLLGHYRDLIESGECCNASKDALEETLEYVFTATGSVEHSRASNKMDPSGAKKNHGDRVMADALALKGLSYTRSGPQKQEPEIPIGSLAWRNQQRENRKKTTTRELSNEWSY
jgi:hypothetical protein